MNIISCDNCGVLLDADKLDFPEDIYGTGETWMEVDETKGMWNDEVENYTPFVLCPVCGSKVPSPCR